MSEPQAVAQAEEQEKVTDNFQEVEDSGFELEIIEDTPEEEKPRRAEGVEPKVPEDSEIEQYSDNVQKRIKQLKFEYHEERRRKEEASKMQEEGEGVLVEQAKGRVDAELDKAKNEYKAAYETGDPDALINAQEKLSKLQNEKFRVESYKPQKREAPAPQPVTSKPKVVEPDEKAKEWGTKNAWFGEDSEMTGYAFGVPLNGVPKNHAECN